MVSETRKSCMDWVRLVRDLKGLKGKQRVHVPRIWSILFKTITGSPPWTILLPTESIKRSIVEQANKNYSIDSVNRYVSGKSNYITIETIQLSRDIFFTEIVITLRIFGIYTFVYLLDINIRVMCILSPLNFS